MTEALSEALKNCPFCGGKAEVIRWSVHCNSPHCNAQPFTSGQLSLAEAVAAWNRRPPSAVQGAIVSEYVIEGRPGRLGSDDIRIARARQMDDGVLWAVRQFGNCLNKDGEWEWEPMPSSRDADFLARCRFDSAEDSISAALRALGKEG